MHYIEYNRLLQSKNDRTEWANCNVKKSLLHINRLEKFIRKNGQMSQLPNVLDTSDCLHYCAIVAIMKKCSLRRERELYPFQVLYLQFAFTDPPT